MMPVQLGLGNFLTTATQNTANVPSDVQNIISRLLGIVYYLVLAGLLIGIFYYGAQLALGERPDEAKKKLLYVALGFIVVFLLPKIIDWVATGQSGTSGTSGTSG